MANHDNLWLRVLIISTFISHTVASVLLIPIAFEIGNSMPVNHSRLTAVNLEDEFGTLFLL
ncbi:hypothetical protein Pst134EA_011753 [Puccinia striiformis f. sp. tritici]|uniref:hypothetical protein n=1 Tax=Puccinia striiformis f. sp. tritici TaxID=168172 RepID=UPI0020080059|nr:hypothetical protein Pst134EA_011753 [Puccinia striiformis f. sp. tritici]KAH9468132.1 hypothetical protein Pst134EA_011753 [Puccinia striiformis f. sp. tritici]